MESGITAQEAYGICEEIAESRGRATARSEYGDGYRTAAEHIAEAIRAQRNGAEASPLERELRDAEVEARTFARVINAAVCVIEGSGEHPHAVEAVRALVHTFFDDGDLPPILRHSERGSSTRLSERIPVNGASPRAVGGRARAVVAGARRSTIPPFDPAG